MAKRLGCVLVFKKGVSKERAAKALAMLGGVVDFPGTTTKYVDDGFVLDEGRRVRKTKPVMSPFKHEDVVHEFDDEREGSPVWYIP